MVSFRTKFDRGLAAAGKVEHDFANFSTEENLATLKNTIASLRPTWL